MGFENRRTETVGRRNQRIPLRGRDKFLHIKNLKNGRIIYSGGELTSSIN